ncbi:hypothetical protein [uncultured Flavonifractor sp.]|uniref:hypothetical protein n=1 Tax=uncultured Flavonifractor sp. TaxID=1193534 RepID=UPI002592614D|nr:hypothetical protein [uncultured Flavonifractor sp.]
MSKPKRDVKDNLFTYLFSQPEYAQQLYLALNPEDSGVTAEDFKLVVPEDTLAISQYNDLGFLVRDKLILIIEVKSSCSRNIPLRVQVYLTVSYKEYARRHGLLPRWGKPADAPTLELYEVYTGGGDGGPSASCLNIQHGTENSEDGDAKAQRELGHEDILGQYIEFCKILDDQVAIQGHTYEALHSTIHICLTHGVLASFLEAHKEEVIDIMTASFAREASLDAEQSKIRKAGLEEG